jgi:hypothetical protein
MLASVLLVLSLLAAKDPASGTLAISNQTSTTITFVATFSGVPKTSHPELSVNCSNPSYLNAQAAPDGGDKDAPWAVTFGPPSPYAYPPQGDQCSALLYYYTWQGGTQTGRVDLASVSFST